MEGVCEMADQHKHGVSEMICYGNRLWSGGVDGALLVWQSGKRQGNEYCEAAGLLSFLFNSCSIIAS